MDERNTHNPGIIFRDIDALPGLAKPVGTIKVLGKKHKIPARDDIPTAADDALNNMSEYMDGLRVGSREYKERECDLFRLIIPTLPPSATLVEKLTLRQRAAIFDSCLEAWAADAIRRATEREETGGGEPDPLERRPPARKKGTSSGRRSKGGSSREASVRGKEL